MRIDYSEPKKSYITPQAGSNRTRKESSPLLPAIIITAVISLAIGFGSGWMLSQRDSKKGFQAAMEQQSLENSPQADSVVKPLAPKPQPVAPQTTAEPQNQQADGSSTPIGSQPPPETPLSFYKTLPSGQKSNVLGSGINAADNTTVKQALQAIMP
ncbi:MAG: hypothetical protein H7Y05_08065, partial [Steroidobacteraceae bacterium]|nr:hypothetical protein [Deltaproteobacteria bacterium]